MSLEIVPVTFREAKAFITRHHRHHRPPRGMKFCLGIEDDGELVGVATVIFLTTGNATIQLASDPEYRGRVTALWSMALVGTTPIGSPIIGALSDVAGPRYALGLGAVACLAAVIVGGWPADGRRRLLGGPVKGIRNL